MDLFNSTSTGTPRAPSTSLHAPHSAIAVRNAPGSRWSGVDERREFEKHDDLNARASVVPNARVIEVSAKKRLDDE